MEIWLDREGDSLITQDYLSLIISSIQKKYIIHDSVTFSGRLSALAEGRHLGVAMYEV